MKRTKSPPKNKSEPLEPEIIRLLKSYYNLNSITPLLQKGANANEADQDGKTALFFVRDFDGVETLVKYGADLNKKDNSGKSAFHNFFRGPYRAETIEKILKKIPGVNAGTTDNQGNTILHTLIESISDLEDTAYMKANELKKMYIERYEKSIDSLIKNGLNINEKNKDGISPLELSLEILPMFAEVLILAGADISKEPECSSVLKSLREPFLAQIFNKINPEVVDSDGNTILHLLISRGFYELAEKTLDLVDDIDSENNKGETPLCFLCDYGGQNYPLGNYYWRVENGNKRDLARKLLERGARPDIDLTKRGGEPLFVKAVGSSLLDLIIDSWDINVYGHEALFKSLGISSHEDTILLLEKGVDLFVSDGDGRTALHNIFYRNQSHVVHFNEYFHKAAGLLLKSGIDPNARDNEGNTALHYAFENRHKKYLRPLVDIGGDLTITNNEGLMPFEERDDQ